MGIRVVEFRNITLTVKGIEFGIPHNGCTDPVDACFVCANPSHRSNI